MKESPTVSDVLTYEYEGLRDHFPALVGRQNPHWQSFTRGNTEWGSGATLLSIRMKAPLFPWQSDALSKILTLDDEGMWTHGDCVLICPRQNGKSLILSFRIIYGLVKLGEQIVYTAHRRTTAEDIYQRTRDLMQAVPSFRRRITRLNCSQGRGIIEFDNGGKVVFTTRSPDAGRSFTKIDLVIYDEAYDLTDGDQAALNPTQLAAEDPQTIYASTAVNSGQQANGLVFGAARKRGVDGEEGVYAAEWCAPEPMDRFAEATWLYANPSYGVIQTYKKIRSQMRKAGTVVGRKFFDVDILGRGDWPVEEDFVSWPVVPEKRWRRGEDTLPLLDGNGYGIGIDRTLDGEMWSIAAVSRTVEGTLHGEVGYFGPGTIEQIVAYVMLLVDEWNPCAIVTDSNSPALVIEPSLTTLGLEIEKTTAAGVTTATRGFYDDVMGTDEVEPMMTHTPQPATDEAIEGATKRFLPRGDWVLDRQGDAVIVPVTALVYARHALVTFGSAAKKAATPLPVMAGDVAVDIVSAGYDPYSTDIDVFSDAF